jgi:hypothetical protein
MCEAGGYFHRLVGATWRAPQIAVPSAAEAPGERFRSEPQGALRRPRRAKPEEAPKKGAGSETKEASLGAQEAAATPHYRGTSCPITPPPRGRTQR